MKKILYLMNGTLSRVSLPWSETNEKLARAEAHNGDIDIQDDGIKEINHLTVEDRLAALERKNAPEAFVVGKWYYRGDKMVFEDGLIYTCVAPAGVVCVWSPIDYPQYWEKGEPV